MCIGNYMRWQGSKEVTCDKGLGGMVEENNHSVTIDLIWKIELCYPPSNWELC